MSVNPDLVEHFRQRRQARIEQSVPEKPSTRRQTVELFLGKFPKAERVRRSLFQLDSLRILVRGAVPRGSDGRSYVSFNTSEYREDGFDLLLGIVHHERATPSFYLVPAADIDRDTVSPSIEAPSRWDQYRIEEADLHTMMEHHATLKAIAGRFVELPLVLPTELHGKIARLAEQLDQPPEDVIVAIVTAELEAAA